MMTVGQLRGILEIFPEDAIVRIQADGLDLQQEVRGAFFDKTPPSGSLFSATIRQVLILVGAHDNSTGDQPNNA
jgi:hypothetical protein